jgi:hypothetical protein
MDETIPMQTALPTKLRLGGLSVRTGPPFVIACREDDPDEGTFVYPQLWGPRDALFLNWHFDRDMLDRRLPDKPNGRLSRDGGRTWQRQTVLAPPGYKAVTGKGAITAYWHAFEIPGEPGRYRMATWRSVDNGRSWGDMGWTEVAYPGTRGLDIYDPPEGYKLHSSNYKGSSQRPAPPAYLEALYQQAGTRKRGPVFHEICTDADGTLYGLSPTHWLPGGQDVRDEARFWETLDWTRNAILMQISTDGGRTWTYGGLVAFDEKHLITEFDEENLFSEPAMVIYPDGEKVCVMRTGSCRWLYLVRCGGGRTWSEPIQLPIRGVDPHLALLPNGVLALATGRPDCTIHFSLDRGVTWALSESLFTTDRRSVRVADRYAGSTSNPELAVIDDQTLLYIHDVSRHDPAGADEWLKHSGFARIIGRHITLEPSLSATVADLLVKAGKPLRQWGARVLSADRGECPSEAQVPERNKADFTLDGRLDDPFWNGVETHHLRDLETGLAPSLGSAFQVAWSDNALYFAIRCDESDMRQVQSAILENDARSFWEGHTIELLLKTQVHSYYQIVINPSGRVVNIDRKEGIEMRWSSQVEVATYLGVDFWSLEVRVPVVDVSGGEVDPLKGVAGRKPTRTDPWQFNVCRQRVGDNRRDPSAFVPTGTLGFHEQVKFGRLYVRS